MARVVRPGGTLSAYAWDMLGGGFPLEPILAEMRAVGLATAGPPQAEASRMETLRHLWTDAGCTAIETRQILVQRTFVDFNDFWNISLKSGSVGPALAALDPTEAEMLKTRVRQKVPADPAGCVVLRAWANAIKGDLLAHARE